VERLNCALNEGVRARLYQANMPKMLWTEAMATATYLKNRLTSEAIDDDIPLERWNERELTAKELQTLKPFGCIVYDYVDKQIRGPQNKMKPTGTKGCFVCYVSSSSYKYWNFARKCFVISHNLTFKETVFPQASDFEQPPANASSTTTITNPAVEPQSPEPEPEPKFIYDEITVLPLPIGHAFAIHRPLAYSEPVTFKDAMSRLDAKLWRAAMVDEIKANVHNRTCQLADLPTRKKAIPQMGLLGQMRR
jgi:hypothetical protein